MKKKSVDVDEKVKKVKKVKKVEAVELGAAELASKCEMSEKDMKKIFKSLVETLETMSVGSKFQIHKLGTFIKRKRAPRMARNPYSGGKVEVPAKVGIKFKLSNTLKDL